jgi:hypothetical protein
MVSGAIATVRAKSFAGITRRCGVYCPKKSDPMPVVPEWPQFMAGCVRYRASLDTQAPNAPRTKKPYSDDDA